MGTYKPTPLAAQNPKSSGAPAPSLLHERRPCVSVFTSPHGASAPERAHCVHDWVPSLTLCCGSLASPAPSFLALGSFILLGDGMVQRHMDSDARLPEFEAQFYHFPAV